MNNLPYTWNGHDLTTYGCIIAADSPRFGTAQYAEIQRAGIWPLRAGKTFSGNVIILELFPTVGQTIGAFYDAIGLWFNEEADEEPYFVIKDQNNSNKQWRIPAECMGMTEPTNKSVKVFLHAPNPVWTAVDVETNTKNLVSTGETKSITVGGNRIARPQYALKPTAARAGGYGYKRYITVCSQSDLAYADALIITGAAFDHATLVGAGKSLASGDDWRITRDGIEIIRFGGGTGFSTANLRAFVNINLPPQITLTLSGAISAVGAVSTIAVKQTTANLAALKLLAAQKNKLVVITITSNEELFTYTGVDLGAYTITGCTRAQRGSTNKAQVDGATIRHVPFIST